VFSTTYTPNGTSHAFSFFVHVSAIKIGGGLREEELTNERGERMHSLSVYGLRSRIVLSLVLLCMVVACRGVVTPTPEAEPTLEPLLTLPSQFEDRGVVTLGQPTALAFTPDGRLLITQKSGQLRVFKNGLVASPALDISSKICQNSEQGLLGVAVDPNLFTCFTRSKNLAVARAVALAMPQILLTACRVLCYLTVM
jgi:hypothetical protein